MVKKVASPDALVVIRSTSIQEALHRSNIDVHHHLFPKWLDPRWKRQWLAVVLCSWRKTTGI
jgi:hypothetical protein